MHICEPIARMLDKALIRAEERGLDADSLVVALVAPSPPSPSCVSDAKHGVADFISSATSDVTIILRPRD